MSALLRPAYHAPESIEEALALLADEAAPAMIVGGGTLVYPLLAEDRLRAARLVDTHRLSGFARVAERTSDDRPFHLGAGVTYATLLAAPERDVPPLLRRIARGITGGPQIRNQGTVGGSASQANPSSDVPCALVACEAALVLASRRDGERRIPAGSFFREALRTAMARGEMLVALEIPAARTGDRWGYCKVKRSESSWPIAVAAARIREGRVSITLGASTAVPVTLPPLPPEAETIRAAVAAAKVTWWDDELASGAYRRRIAPTVAVRAFEEARGEAAPTEHDHAG